MCCGIRVAGCGVSQVFLRNGAATGMGGSIQTANRSVSSQCAGEVLWPCRGSRISEMKFHQSAFFSPLFASCIFF